MPDYPMVTKREALDGAAERARLAKLHGNGRVAAFILADAVHPACRDLGLDDWLPVSLVAANWLDLTPRDVEQAIRLIVRVPS